MIIVNHYQNGLNIPDLLVSALIFFLEKVAVINRTNEYFYETVEWLETQS